MVFGNILNKNAFKYFGKTIYQQVNLIKMVSHEKLKLYSKLKSSFTMEPYIDYVQSRNQKSWISRLRSSSIKLGIEIGRYKNKLGLSCAKLTLSEVC